MLILLSFHPDVSESSNWAQTSGRLDQNIVITKLPSVENLHWSARFGHATAILNTGELPEIGEVYLTGGDTYSQTRDKGTNVGILAASR